MSAREVVTENVPMEEVNKDDSRGKEQREAFVAKMQKSTLVHEVCWE